MPRSKRKATTAPAASVARSVARKKGLEPPFPSSPSRPPKFHVQVTKKETLVTENFSALYAAKHFIEMVIHNRKISWKDKFTIVVPSFSKEHCDGDGIYTFIKCEPQMEEIMEHRFTREELEWELPEPYLSRARYLATGIRAVHVTAPAPNPILDPEQTEATKKRIASKRPAPPARKDREGLTTIQDICAMLKLEPRIARGILRKSNTPKPDAGWAWPAAEAKKIEALIRKESK